MSSYKLLSEALQRDVYRLSSQLSVAESNNALLLKDLKVRDASIAELVDENGKLKARVDTPTRSSRPDCTASSRECPASGHH